MKSIEIIFDVGSSPYIRGVIIFVSTMLMFYLLRNKLVNYIKEKSADTATKLDDNISEVISKTKFFLLIVISLYLSTLSFELSDGVQRVFKIIFQAALTLQILLLLSAFVNILLKTYLDKKSSENKDLATLYSYVSKIVFVILWVVGALLFLSNAGYDITSLVASIGVGGIAIALAVQNVLKDIFSGITLILNKPIQIGDLIKLDDGKQGTVEKIGFRHTIIRMVDKSELIVPNDDILNSRIQNYRSREKRRVNLLISLDLKTTAEQLQKLKEEVMLILNNIEDVIPEKNRVTFDSYDSYSINLEIVFYLTNPNFDEFVKTKDDVNFRIKEICEKHKIDFATGIKI